MNDRRKNRRKKLYSFLMGAIFISGIIGVWGTVMMYRNRRMTEMMIQAQQEERERAAQEREKQEETAGEENVQEIGIAPGQKEELTADPRDLNLEPILAQDQLIYRGKHYRRNQYVKAILCMGVDRNDTMTDVKELGAAGQSDGIFLLAQDTVHHTLEILMIPRDTMTEIPITDSTRTLQDTMITQLTMAYAYGDGKEESCRNTVQSVEKLLSGFSIDAYLAVDTAVVPELNDAVGGVTVTIPTDGMEKSDPSFIRGEQVTLHGKQAEKFVRYRDINRDFSALYRMDQQQEYITQFFQAVKNKSKTDSQIVQHLFDLIQDYMVTDLNKDQYLKIAMDGIQAESLKPEDFCTVPGTGETTNQYDVYRADRREAIEIILNLFYRETS